MDSFWEIKKRMNSNHEQVKTRNPGSSSGGIRCLGRESIPCRTVSPAVLPTYCSGGIMAKLMLIRYITGSTGTNELRINICQNSLPSATSCPSKSVLKCSVETTKVTDDDSLLTNLQTRLEQTQCRLKTQSNGNRTMDCFTLNVSSVSTSTSPNCVGSSPSQIENENRIEKKTTEVYRISIALAGFGGIVFGAAAAVFTMSAVAKRKQIKKKRKGASFINATYEHSDFVIPATVSGRIVTEPDPHRLRNGSEPTNEKGSHLPGKIQ